MAIDIPARAQAHGYAIRWQAKLNSLVARLWLCRDIRRERAQLRALNDRELRDIGITRYDALHEAMKPFWRL